MSNLDPALDGSAQQRNDNGSLAVHANYDRTSGDRYRVDSSNITPPYGTSAQQTPYYQYQSSVQPSAHDSVSASSAQPTPDAHSFLPHNTHQTFLQPEDAQANQDDPKRQRACEACRGLKVRCDQDPQQPDVPCRRCAKAGRQCIITQPSRKRQKKADSRVAELEKKLDALTAVLHNRQSVGSLDAPPDATSSHRDQTQHDQASSLYPDAQGASFRSEEPPTKRRRTEEEPSQWDTRFAQLQLVYKYPDAKSYLSEFFTNRITQLVPRAQGAEWFKRYTEQLTQQIPLVVFPSGTSADQLFQDKPVLYLAVVAAASFGQTALSTTAQLQDETMAAIAELCVRRGVKSLELIQSMHVVAFFFKPPEKAEQTNFYQVIHMAAVMGLDIGLGRRYSQRRQAIRQEVVFSAKAMTSQNSDLIEARRAWLGCYYLSATASMVLRRPNLVRWTEYMKECVEVLETSPEAAPSDRLLCQHVKIQRICEDIGQQFLMDDSTAQVSINDPKVTYALNVLENQLKSWRLQIPADIQNPSLTYFEHVTNLYLHEIALHSNHNIDDFRLPFTEESLRNVDSASDALSPTKIAAIDTCLKAAHGVLSTLLTYTVEQLLALPMIVFFVRCVYALVILIKMYVAITMPNSELGKILKPEDLKIEFYVYGLLQLFRSMGDNREAKSDKIVRILGVLSEWFVKHKESVAMQSSSNQGGSDGVQAGSVQPGTTTRYDQTPLQMLSQVATGQQQHNHSVATDWTVDRPTPLNYRQNTATGQSGNILSAHQAQQHPHAASMDPNIMSMLDMLSGQDYGWSTGFEQAMDLTLGSVGSLPGGGFDNWFPGDNQAPINGGTSDNPGPHGAWNGV